MICEDCRFGTSFSFSDPEIGWRSPGATRVAYCRDRPCRGESLSIGGLVDSRRALECQVHAVHCGVATMFDDLDERRDRLFQPLSQRVDVTLRHEAAHGT